MTLKTKESNKNETLAAQHLTNSVPEFVCGWGASFANICVTYPIHKVMFRQMLHGVEVKPAIQMLRHEGIGFLYRGILPPLAQKTISLSLMFGVYDGAKRPLINQGMNEYLAKVIAAVTAGTVEGLLMPFERIQTLLADSTHHNKFKNTNHAFQYCYVNYGYRELFRGGAPIIIRNGSSNALFFILREEAAKHLAHINEPYKKSVFQFFSGGLIGAFLSSIFYPINVVKTHMQNTIGTPYISISEAFMRVYRERGSKLSHVYKGVGVNCSRSFLSWGIINTVYEVMKNLFFNERKIDR